MPRSPKQSQSGEADDWNPGQREVGRWIFPVCISSCNCSLEKRTAHSSRCWSLKHKGGQGNLKNEGFPTLGMWKRENIGIRFEYSEICMSGGQSEEGKWCSMKRKAWCEVREQGRSEFKIKIKEDPNLKFTFQICLRSRRMQLRKIP